MGEYPITEEQVRFYQENGYIRLEGVLSIREVEALRVALDVAEEDRCRS